MIGWAKGRHRAWFAVLAVLASGGCALSDPLVLDTPPASIAAPTLRPFADGVNWVVERDVVFTYPGWPSIRVPAGFVTDLASVPAAARAVRSRVGTYSRAAILHDWLYWSGVCTRSQADRIMLHAMRSSGTSPDVARQMYRAISAFGGEAFEEDARERRAGIRRSVPAEALGQLDNHDWPSVQAALGTVAPPVEGGPPPTYCLLGGPAEAASRDVRPQQRR